NEVKELLFELHKGYEGSVTIKTINFTKGNPEIFDFVPDNEIETSLSEPKKYLYEPNAAIMKSQGFGALSKYHNITKLHRHSHLFTSEQLIDFQERAFEIEMVFPYKRNSMKKDYQGKKENKWYRTFRKPE